MIPKFLTAKLWTKRKKKEDIVFFGYQVFPENNATVDDLFRIVSILTAPKNEQREMVESLPYDIKKYFRRLDLNVITDEVIKTRLNS